MYNNIIIFEYQFGDPIMEMETFLSQIVRMPYFNGCLFVRISLLEPFALPLKF